MVDGPDFMTSNGFLCVPTLFTSVPDITVTVFDIFKACSRIWLLRFSRQKLRFSRQKSEKPSMVQSNSNKGKASLTGCNSVVSLRRRTQTSPPRTGLARWCREATLSNSSWVLLVWSTVLDAACLQCSYYLHRSWQKSKISLLLEFSSLRLRLRK